MTEIQDVLAAPKFEYYKPIPAANFDVDRLGVIIDSDDPFPALHEWIAQTEEPHLQFHLNYVAMMLVDDTGANDRESVIADETEYFSAARKALEVVDDKSSYAYRRQKVIYLTCLVHLHIRIDQNFHKVVSIVDEIFEIDPDLNLLTSDQLGALMANFLMARSYLTDHPFIARIEEELERDPSRIPLARRFEIMVQYGVVMGHDAVYFEQLREGAEAQKWNEEEAPLIQRVIKIAKREHLMALDKDDPEYEKAKDLLLAEFDAASPEEKNHYLETWLKVFRSEARARKSARQFQLVAEKCQQNEFGFEAAEVVIEALDYCGDEFEPDREVAKSQIVTSWRILEETLGESLAIFFSELEMFLSDYQTGIEVSQLLEEGDEAAVKFSEFLGKLPLNLQQLARVLVRYFVLEKGSIKDFRQNFLSAYWSSEESMEVLNYNKRQAFSVPQNRLNYVCGARWGAAVEESYTMTLGLSATPHPDWAIMSVSDETEVHFDDRGQVEHLSGGQVLGALAASEASFVSAPFFLSGFDIESVSELEELMTLSGVDIDDCIECGSLSTFPISREKVILDLLREAALVIKSFGKEYGIMVTHKAAELACFRRNRLKKGVDYFILDEEAQIRVGYQDRNDEFKDAMARKSEVFLGIDRFQFESMWSGYINNPRLPLNLYIVKADSILMKFR